MKRKFLLSAVLFQFLLAAGPAVPVIRMELREERPQVAETGKLTEFSPAAAAVSAPEGTAAARLASGKDHQWQPSQLAGRATGGADLADIVLSPDESLLVMAERVGGENKPNSTRFILVGLRDRKIIRAVTLKERRISHIAFIPGTDRLIASEDAQSGFDRKNGLAVIDLKEGRLLASSRPEESPVTSLCTDGKKVWYTVEKSGLVRELALDRLGEGPEKIRTQVPEARVILSSDGGMLISFGREKCERFKINAEGPATLHQSCDTERDFSPVQAVSLNGDGSNVLLLEPAGRAILSLNGSSRILTEKSGAVAAFFKKENILLLGLLKNDGIVKIPLPAAEPEGKPVTPGKLKPASRNGNLKLLALSGSPVRAVLVDTRANVMMLEITRRRWKKIPILTVDKTGFR
ncbi:MAG: hypothetical protein IJU70_05565 [Lentisphaeria bacterium]|nr:hypothetical protein [Lentisphaeria bacterium]